MTGVAMLSGLLAAVLPLVVILVATVLLAWLVGGIVDRLVRFRNPQLVRAARQLAVGGIVIIGATLILQQLGVNADIILVFIGLVGAAIVIALRGVLNNYGARYFLGIYTPFKVGDTIRVGSYSGQVIGTNPMATVLLSDSDTLVSIPNATLLNQVIENTSPQAWKEVLFPVSLSANVDLPTFESDLLKSFAKLRTRLDPQFPPVLTTKARTPQSTEVVLTLMLRRPEDRETIVQEGNKRLAELLGQGRGARRPITARVRFDGERSPAATAQR